MTQTFRSSLKWAGREKGSLFSVRGSKQACAQNKKHPGSFVAIDPINYFGSANGASDTLLLLRDGERVFVCETTIETKRYDRFKGKFAHSFSGAQNLGEVCSWTA